MRNPRRLDRLSLVFLIILISFFAFLIIFPCTYSGKDIKYRFDSKDHSFQLQGSNDRIDRYIGRRNLRGRLGSSPPRCASRCGNCTPCRPVHVPVPPGTPVTAEYYPEAWRCKCGNKLYMP